MKESDSLQEMDVCIGCGQPLIKSPAAKYRHIISELAAAHGVEFAEVMGDCRTKLLVEARQACFAMLMGLGLSSAHVGRMMNRDHSTVLYGVKQHRMRQSRLKKGLPG